MNEKLAGEYRYFLKDTIRKLIDFSGTDQHKGVAPPPVEKPVDPSAPRINLPRDPDWTRIRAVDVAAALRNRRSVRTYSEESISLEELSFLLWATQGVRGMAGKGTTLRTVPSAGARHALETYIFALNVDSLERGCYRFLPIEHQLVALFTEDDLAQELTHAVFDQAFVAGANAVFAWTTIPYRMEWRYGLAAHKVIALDAGHVCQNLYIACEAIDAGACAIAAYDQEAMDRLLRVDGEDEFAIYLAAVGKRKGP